MIEHEAAPSRSVHSAQRGICVRKTDHTDPSGIEREAQRVPDRRIIIYNDGLYGGAADVNHNTVTSDLMIGATAL